MYRVPRDGCEAIQDQKRVNNLANIGFLFAWNTTSTRLTSHFLRMSLERFQLLERPDVKQPDEPISTGCSNQVSVPAPFESVDYCLVRSSSMTRFIKLKRTEGVDQTFTESDR